MEPEEKIDQYMHSMLNEEQADAVDSYLPAVFEYLILQHAEKASHGESERRI